MLSLTVKTWLLACARELQADMSYAEERGNTFGKTLTGFWGFLAPFLFGQS